MPSVKVPATAFTPGSLADRVAGGLWGMFIADALAMPAHWFYGGAQQIRSEFGGPLTGYRQSPQGRGSFPGSIMALSNTGGAGRGGSQGEIVGSVINHGKKQYWERGSGYHYHVTLQAGETTLEGEMARLTMRHLTSGDFDRDRFQKEYVDFMTTPGSHNDAYCSSYHRMFFQKRATGAPLRECPSNDGHNVDAIDGLVEPAVVFLGYAQRAAAAGGGAAAVEAAKESVRAVRSSRRVEDFATDLGAMLLDVVAGKPARDAALESGRRLGVGGGLGSGSDPVVACYIDQSYAAMLHFAAKYGGSFEKCLLASANAGGENVHRGLVLGALVGAEAGASAIPAELKEGLRWGKEIGQEIQAFVAARIGAEAAAPSSDL